MQEENDLFLFRMSKALKITTFCSVFLLLLFSCEKFDSLKENWRPSLAVPLLYTTVDVYDILAKANRNDLVIINENTGLLALSYKGVLVSSSPSDIVQLPNQSGTFVVNSPLPLMPISGSISQSVSQTQTLLPSGIVELSKIIFRSGKLIYSLGSSFGGSGSVDFSIVSLSKDGSVFQRTINLNTLDTLDLAGFELDLSKTSLGFNEFLMNITATITGSAGDPIPSPMATFSIDLKDLDYEEVYGDFKTQTVTADEDSILIKLFGKLKDVGQISFEGPSIHLYATNSFGFPVRISFDDLYTYNTISGDTFKLGIDPNSSTFDIDYPPASRIGDSTLSSITFNRSNSTVEEIVSPTPKWLISKVTGIMNVDGVPAENHLHRDAKLQIETELELPLSGKVFNYGFRDTSEYSFSESIDEIDSILVRANIINGFPIDAQVQVYLTDENYKITDSIFPGINENLIASGKINSKGRVSEPAKKVTDVKIQKDRVPNITNASYLITDMRFQTSQKGDVSVKIFDDYEISLKIGLKVDGKVPLGDSEGN